MPENKMPEAGAARSAEPADREGRAAPCKSRPVALAALLECSVALMLAAACIGGIGFWSSAQALDSVAKNGAAGPVFSNTGPDAAGYGAGQDYPSGSRTTMYQQPYIVWSESHLDKLFGVHSIDSPGTSWPFKRAGSEPEIAYTYRSNRFTLADYLARNPVTGLLIAKDDTILVEHYQYARDDRSRFHSESMAKTITAMLIGIAVFDHSIKSIDDTAATYVPGLQGTEYGKTRIRDLLHMSSGVAFNEDYGGQDDLGRLNHDLGVPGNSTAAAIAQFNRRIAAPGKTFHYASIENLVLGLVLRNATGKSVADFMERKIWQPMGAEADASWIIDTSRQESTYCCFSAVLRDYARFGRLLARDGDWQGKQLIPRQWIIDATTVGPNDGYLAPEVLTPFYGYGFQVWIFPGGRPGERRMFALLGIHGQSIFIDPISKLVMVNTAVRKIAVDPAADETRALWAAVLQQFGNKAP
jgi:CubicO group peptidase (beta-lactamase class C family)